MKTYRLTGTYPQLIFETKERIALYSDDLPFWRMCIKSREAQKRPISDWDYEELRENHMLSRCAIDEVILWLNKVIW